MAGRGSSSNEGPSAFEIKLGISTGRHSPDEDKKTVMVNAETTVNWIFMQAAYLLSHIHRRDRNTLQHDFDLCLVRPGSDIIVLNPSRVIADYKIKKNDELQLHHKTLPLPICVNLCEGEERKVEVNSGFPLIDIVPVICQELGISNHKELSLALPSSGQAAHTMQYEWLDLLSSLNGQGVQHGDTLLLRKKFFILNDDIQEALDGNKILMELLYQQIRDMFIRENYVGTGKECMASCAKVAALLHQIEQKEENISDEELVCNVIPKHLQNNAAFYGQLVTTYYSERVQKLSEDDAKRILLHFFSTSQSILVNYFPVQKSRNDGDAEDLILSVDSDRIKICREITDKKELEVADDMDWRLRDLRDTECTSQKDKQLRVNILGSWHEFVTDHRIQISRYLLEAQALTKLRVIKGRMSTLNPLGPDIAGAVHFNMQQAFLGIVSEERPIKPEEHPAQDEEQTIQIEVPLPPLSPEVIVEQTTDSERDTVMADVEETSPMENGVEDLQSIKDDEESGAETDVVRKVEAETEVVGEVEANGPEVLSEGEVSGTEDAREVEVTSPSEVVSKVENFSVVEKKTKTEHQAEVVIIPRVQADAEFDLDDINEAMEGISDSNSQTSSLSKSVGSASATFVPPPPPSLATTPHHKKSLEALGIEASPAKSLSSARSTYVQIPEFLGQDFREVLEDYRLFHVVVMKQDVRSVLLHVNKPVQEVVDSLCGTFDIPNPGGFYLWIPKGIQNIIEKYGGKPKKRAGKFTKQHQNGRDFSPRLDSSKTLKQQYNFSIKPFLLHLRHYQSVEGVDGAEETDCGTEWPDYENPDVARYRRFYQSWTGIVQGAFPIERKGAVKLAALLTHIYYGDREKSQVWPPRDYDAGKFLPEKLKNSFGITSEVEKLHRDLSGKSTQDCINDVVEGCRQLPTMEGVFFQVAVPVKSDILALIPWNKMERRWFGINRNGVFCMDGDLGEVVFTQKFSDISKWSSTENSLKLTFRNSQFDAYTYQAKEILDMLEMFIQLRLKGRARSSEPEKRSSRPSSEVFSTPQGCYNGDTLKKVDLSLQLDRSQSLISPTTYDL